MLAIHSGWIVFPPSFPARGTGWRKRREPETLFFAAWIALFFGGRESSYSSRVRPAICCQMAGAACASWPRVYRPNGWRPPSRRNSRWRSRWHGQLPARDGYRAFAATLRGPSSGHRVWVDNDWGLRYYLEADHGCPRAKVQQVRPTIFNP